MGTKSQALWLLAALLLVAGPPARAAAADESPWKALADTVIRPVMGNADLPHALVPVAMEEDSAGFLWLGGAGGLLRWDGYEFRDYPAQPNLADGIRDADISELHRDAAHRLWVGTRSNGLTRYDPGQDRLICVELAGGSCGTQYVHAIDDDGAGGLWVATASGLFRLDATGKPVLVSRHSASQSASLPDDDVLAVLRDRHGIVWAGTKGGLAESTDQGRNFIRVPLNGRPVPSVSQLMEDSDGRLWIGTRYNGAFVLGADRGPGPVTARAIAATAPTQANDTAVEVTALLEVAPGRVWLGTDGRGIVEVNGQTLRTRRIAHDPFVPDSLNSNSVQSLFRDASGLVWISTYDGLSEYNPGRGIMTFFGHHGRGDGLPGESAMSVLATQDGNIWAGFQSDGFAVLDPAGHHVTGLAGHQIEALAPAPAGGGVLLGTDGGLFLADSSGAHVKRLQVPEQSPTLDVRALASTPNGDVWLGARDGGLWQMRIGAGDDIDLVRHITGPDLTNPVVAAIATAPDGRVAIGTNSGFNLIDPVTGSIERIPANSSDMHGLDAGVVDCFVTDGHGRLWVGTPNGLDVLEGRDAGGRPQFHRLGIADGLPNATIDGLLVDRQGLIWAATDMGLAVINPDNFAIRPLQRADALAITNYWSDAAAKTPDGDLVFGGLGGLTLVRPDASLQWRYRPPVVFTAARIGGRPVTISSQAGGMLVVPPDANSLAVEFAALDFSAPTRNRYRYRLDGFDADWQDTDAEHRVATYTNLPPGDYMLRLMGSNRDGHWTAPETRLQIRVLPAWYQTFSFRIAATAVAGLVAAVLMRGWMAILNRRHRELERQVEERTDELSASKRALQHANAELELRVADRTYALVERTAALEASEARFRAWFNNAEDAVFVVQVEPDGRFVYEAVNAAVERVFGIEAAAYPGRQPGAVLPPEYAAEMLGHYREAVKGTPIQFETRFAATGGERLLDTWIVPLRHPVSGRVERLVGASRDMTERRALETRLAQAQKLQALGGLAGGIAHDFNNILQAVGGAAMLIEQRPDSHETIQRLARSTIAAAERGTSITRRLLAFARSDELRVEAMPTADVLQGLCEVLTYTLGSIIIVRSSLAPGLPPLLADRGQLETALVNLGTNARDAMPGGGVLTLSAEPEWVAEGAAHPAGLAPGAYVRIGVADTGSGMDAATLARVIEPFFTTKPPGHGTGLGLALVKGFAEQSGGGMVIESTLGVGTTVKIWLRQPGADAVQRAAQPAGNHATRAAPACVLVVDDDDLVRETLAEQLERGGFQVVAAAGGVEALASIQAGARPDALVCDLSMPGMNGIEVIKRARDLCPGLPCFLLTGYAGEHAALPTGNAFTLLRKPISTNALIAQIDAGLTAGQGLVLAPTR